MTGPKRTDQDFSEEIQAHLELEAARLIAQGVPPEEARDRARRSFGNVTAAQEQFFERRRWLWLERLRQDIGYTLRGMRAHPGFGLTAVLTLAGGIGFNTAVFTLLYSLALRSLPVPNPSQVVNVYQDFRGEWGRIVNGNVHLPSHGEYVSYRDGSRSFEALAAYAETDLSMAGDQAAPVRATLASCNYFTALGVRTAKGRVFLPEECAQPGDGPVVVLSDGFWRSRFGADSGIIGRPILLNQVPFTVVGVAAPKFAGLEWRSTDLWAPVTMQLALDHGRDSSLVTETSWLTVVGRLKPRISPQQARSELAAIARRGDLDHPGRETVVIVNRGSFANSPETRQRGLFMGVAVLAIGVLIVLIACANVMSLLLTRALARRREIGIRLSLGASRRRLVQQFLTESTVLALIGGAAGVALAWLLPPLLVGTIPVTGVQLDLRPDFRVLAYALTVSLGAALVFGLAPALRATDLSLTSAMRNDTAAGGRKSGTTRLRNLVVGMQIAGSTLLLVVAGLFVRATQRAYSIDPGYATERITAVSTSLSELGYDPVRASALQDEIERRIGAIPGVEAVALAERLPLMGRHTTRVTAEAGTDSKRAEDVPTGVRVVSGSYFGLMGIALLRGRAFTDAEANSSALRPAVVSDAFAQRLWPGLDPLGRRFKEGESVFYVTGVAEDVRNASLTSIDGPFIYPAVAAGNRMGPGGLSVIARTGGPAASITKEIPSIVRSVAPEVVVRVETMEERMALVALPTRLGGLLATVFGLLALAMAFVGVYGVVSYGVSQRTREIGVRLALGATGRDAIALVMRQGTRVALMGIVAGMLLAAVASRLLGALLLGLPALDPVAFLGVAAALLLAALLAMYSPARKAARIDPALTLRQD